MKTTHDSADSGDGGLSRWLGAWKVKTPLPPQFKQGVWQRIAAEPTPRSSGMGEILRRWIQGLLPRPAYAMAYISMLICLGALAGWIHAGQRSHHWESALGARYLESVNPYQSPPASRP